MLISYHGGWRIKTTVLLLLDGKSCTEVRIEQAYKGNFHLYASIDGRDCKFIIGKNKPEYATIQETGLSNLPETMLRDLVAKYLVR